MDEPEIVAPVYIDDALKRAFYMDHPEHGRVRVETRPIVAETRQWILIDGTARRKPRVTAIERHTPE